MPLVCKTRGHTAILTLSRPDARNCWGQDYHEGLLRYVLHDAVPVPLFIGEGQQNMKHRLRHNYIRYGYNPQNRDQCQ